MAFNPYIIINDGTDTYWYKTIAKTWMYKPNNPSTARVLLSGSMDVTYGNADIKVWEGDIKAPVTSPGGNYGTIATLRTQLARKVLFTFTDHYGTVHTDAAIQGNFEEQSIQPDWDVASNEILVKVRITAT
jgi:hypothetical protein